MSLESIAEMERQLPQKQVKQARAMTIEDLKINGFIDYGIVFYVGELSMSYAKNLNKLYKRQNEK